MRRAKVTLFLGVGLLIGTTALFLLLNQDRKLVDWLSFAFVIWADLIVLGAPFLMELLPGGQEHRPLYRNLIVIYVVLTILVGLLFMNTTRESIKMLLILQFLLLLAMGILIRVFSSTEKMLRHRVLHREIEAEEGIWLLVEKLEKIEAGEPEAWISQSLRDLCGRLRLSDAGRSTSMDRAIQRGVEILEDQIFQDEREFDSIERSFEELLRLERTRQSELRRSALGKEE